jgi:hypothetical protein
MKRFTAEDRRDLFIAVGIFVGGGLVPNIVKYLHNGHMPIWPTVPAVGSAIGAGIYFWGIYLWRRWSSPVDSN